MTKEQIKLVEENHNLIYYVLNKWGLDHSEYYDICALGLCKAAIKYDESISKFSTFAVYCMETRLRMEHRNKINKKNLAHTSALSLNEEWDDEGAKIDMFVGRCYLEDELILVDIRKLLTEQQKKIFDYLLLGYNQVDISRLMNISQPVVSRKVSKIRNIVRKELCYGMSV